MRLASIHRRVGHRVHVRYRLDGVWRNFDAEIPGPPPVSGENIEETTAYIGQVLRDNNIRADVFGGACVSWIPD